MYLWMFRCGNIVLLTTTFFDVAKFTVLTPLSLLSWCRLSFPIVGLQIFSLPAFALASSNRKMIENLPSFLTNTDPRHSTFLFSWCLSIQNSDITPATSQNHIWYPIANKLYSLNCWYYSVVCKKSCSQMMIFFSLFHRKCKIPWSSSACFIVLNPLYTPYI